jgi:nicotinate-nucleotide pyrophosphorylase (carboxylating)
MQQPDYFANIAVTVAGALLEDIGSGDITAQLVPVSQQAHARVITREAAVICGRPWVMKYFAKLTPA